MDIYVASLVGFGNSAGKAYINLLGCNFTVRKDLFIKNGLFDEDFKFACEDRDFFQRLLQNRQEVLYTPQVIATHYYKRNIISFIKQQISYGIYSYLLEKKWGKGVNRNVDKGIILNHILQRIDLPVIIIYLITGCSFRIGYLIGYIKYG